ncbi:MAG: hypothetical protein HKN40_06010 [Winogradskyella sp.]|uniref:hypothetical protein n=1 Tax=Winogradskyella sp. TaxID=1883156 RepID=UPI001850A94E|nr:hypothetical protein [Winogradskyella sp.]
MKNVIIIAMTLFTIYGMAQQQNKRFKDGGDKSELRKEMTPKDIADLKSKKLTLQLDLSQEQQKEVHSIILKQSEERKAQRENREHNKEDKPSKDDFVKKKNERLEQAIEMKQKMKSVLTSEQYAKFETLKPEKRKHKVRRKSKRNKH